MKEQLTSEQLSTSNKYWFENFCQKSNQVDALCTYAAENLGRIDYEIWRYNKGEVSGLVANKHILMLRGQKTQLDHILTHFHGFLDLDFLIANDLGQEDIERNKTREERYKR